MIDRHRPSPWRSPATTPTAVALDDASDLTVADGTVQVAPSGSPVFLRLL